MFYKQLLAPRALEHLGTNMLGNYPLVGCKALHHVQQVSIECDD